jgi:hypothetical protein
MGVNIKGNLVEGQQAKEVDDGKVKLELKLFERYARKGNLYEKGKVYVFDKDTAAAVLKLHDNGKPIFVRHKPKPSTRILEIAPQEVDMNSATPQNSFKDLRPGEKTKIEIGDDSELEGIVPKDSDGDDDDSPAGVDV